MTEPTARNRLDEAASPYLRQHADNPVNWQPWDDEALEAARERDVPIFLSIGYAACHWCHVMAEESFADEGVASVLNEHFVPIKVDREERPDVDDVYMSVHQLVRGGGGWPLSVFLTPDQRPFYVGTYLPKEPRRGQTGFRQLCSDIAEAWADPAEREDLESRADQWAQAVTDELEAVPETAQTPDDDLLMEAVSGLCRQADREHGGFGSGQKFPQPSRIHLLLRGHRRSGDETALTVATEALDAMADGGLRDQLGGGFHRYCTDREWVVPHFEKMLYDNAALTRAYLAGYRATDREAYAHVARETLGFLDRELRHPGGGFYSTLDARSGDEEGQFYVWTPAQVRAACEAAGLDAPERVAERACTRWGIDEAGDIEGRSVPTQATSVEAIAEATGTDVQAVEAELARAKEAMLAARTDRERPPRDEKVLAGWNGLAISAFAEAALTIDPAYGGEAAETLSFVRDHHWDGDVLYRRWRDGDRGVRGYLQDYAFLARAALDTFQVSGDVDHLAFALKLADRLVERFYDASRETLYTASEDSGSPLARPQELRDQSTPSSVAVACDVLLAVDHVDTDAGHAEIAETVLSRHGTTLEREPMTHASMIGAADRLNHGVVEITVPIDYPDSWRDVFGGVPEPDRVLYPRPGTADGLGEWSETLGLDAVPPVWADRGPREGRPTAYVCRRACSPPLSEAAEIREWLDRFA